MKNALVLSLLVVSQLCLAAPAKASTASLAKVADLASKNKPAQALAILNRIEKSKSSKVDPDLLKMTKGRILYQLGKLDEAYKTYNSVSKSSPYWFESVEERAHAMGKKGNYAKAIADLQTLMVPTFAGAVGPEPYFVSALTQLRICNYTGVFADTKKFKENYSPRIATLKKIKTTGTNPGVEELLKKLKKDQLSFETVGSLIKDLPRDLHADRYALSLNTKTESGRAKLKNHIVKLAERELKEIDVNITKLQLVEAEVVHRIALAEKSNKERKKQGSIQSGADTLNFPVTDEVWIDELDSYAAQVEKCPPAEKRVSL